MLVAFKELPESSRVWIYQADQRLSEKDIEFILAKATIFCDQWAAHNVPLKSSFNILHNKFLILAVDEGQNAASGCSIDSSVHFVQTVEKQLNLNFFDRTQVAFLIDDNVYTTDLQSIKDDIESGTIAADTMTFNMQAENVAEFQENWLVPAGESWMKKYF